MTEMSADELTTTLANGPARAEVLVRRMGRQLTLAAVAAADANGNDAEWTASEILGHLCDAARVWGGRMRRTVYEHRPTLLPYDERLEVTLGAYRYQPLAPLLRQYRLLSEENVAFLRQLVPSAWECVAVHPDYGALTLYQIVAIEREHEESHLVQLARALGIGD